MTQIIKPAVEDIEAQLLGIYNCLCIRQFENSTVKQCLIHLGVNAAAKQFHIEKYAINQTDFLVSDEREWKPK